MAMARRNYLFTGMVLALIIVTLLIDAWAAYGLGHDKFTTGILITIAIVGGLYKCIALPELKVAWRRRDLDGKPKSLEPVRGLVIIVLMLVAWAQSITFELTFYQQNYGDAAAIRAGSIERSQDLHKEKATIEANLDDNKKVKRTPDEVSRDIDRNLARVIEGRTLGQLTRDCTNTKHYDYRHCTAVLALRGELESAKKVAQWNDRLSEIRAGDAWVTRSGDAHPGAAAVAKLASWWLERDVDQKQALFGLILLSMFMVQLFTALSAYALLTNEPRGASPVSAKPVAQAQALTDGQNAASISDVARVDKIEAGRLHAKLPALGGASTDRPFRAAANDDTEAAAEKVVVDGVIREFGERYLVSSDRRKSESFSDMYNAYVEFAGGPGLARSLSAFSRALQRLYPHATASKAAGDRHYKGLQLTPAGKKLAATQIVGRAGKEKQTGPGIHAAA